MRGCAQTREKEILKAHCTQSQRQKYRPWVLVGLRHSGTVTRVCVVLFTLYSLTTKNTHFTVHVHVLCVAYWHTKTMVIDSYMSSHSLSHAVVASSASWLVAICHNNFMSPRNEKVGWRKVAGRLCSMKKCPTHAKA